MKTSIALLLLFVSVSLGFAQGKIGFSNDSLHLVYFSPIALHLAPGDAAVAGKGVYSTTIAALTGSPTLVADLWAGTSCSALSKQTSTTFGSNEGNWNPANVILSSLAAGVTTYFQIQIHDARDMDAYASQAAGHYYGFSPCFTAVPQFFTYTPIYFTSSPVFSTWPAGSFPIVDMPAGNLGAIEVMIGPQDPPWIVYSPSSQTVWLDAPFSLNVIAAGGVLSYQWRLNGTNLLGATTSTYARDSAQFDDAGAYTVVVTNGFGIRTSSVAMLQVLPFGAPSIRVNGELAVGAVSAIGSAQLAISGGFTNGSIFYTLDGSAPTTNSLRYTNAVTVTTAATIQAMSLSADASQTAVAPPVLLTFNLPPSVTVPPQSQDIPAGSGLTLSVLASGTPPLSYQWRNNLGPIAGATNSSYTINPVQTNHAGSYSVVVSSPYGAVTSAVATVFVYVPVSITVPPANQAVSAGATASFSVLAGGYPSPSYQWTFQGTNLAGATLSSLTITNVRLLDCGDYLVGVGNGYPSDQSAGAVLSMLPSIDSPYIGATAIWGRSATLSVGAIGTGDLSYQWLKDGVAIPDATNRDFTLPAVQFGDGGFYSVEVCSALGCVTNTPAQLIVNPADMGLGLYAGITITGAAGYHYEVQYTRNLTVTNAWVTLTNLTLQAPVELWVDTTTNAAETHRRFYRILPGQ